MSKINNPIMRYHGGKFRLAPWIIGFFPEHSTYVEPFGGAGGVLIQKEKSLSEVYNDLDCDIVNVFRVLQDRYLSIELMHRMLITPFARQEFNLSFEEVDDPVEKARRTLIRASMGFGSGGATKGRTGFRVDSNSEYSSNALLWSRYPPIIATFCERLQQVIIENRKAETVIENHDRFDTLFYIDPPYMLDTRHEGSKTKIYRHEMSDKEHVDLIKKVTEIDGMVILSGYDTEMYNDVLKGWTKHQKQVSIAGHRGASTRMESVWLNKACVEKQKQANLF